MGLNLLRIFQPTNSDKLLGGRYKIISQLGVGGFGQTFLAEDLHLPGCPQCVIKQLKPRTNDPILLQTARRLFDTEAQTLYQLGNHDQIPRLLAHFEENQEFYLAQELIIGAPLTQELVKGKRWSEPATIALLQDILQVLTFVHEQNVIHRDLKPANLIRRQRDGKIVLIDFGAVKQVSTQLLNPQSGQTNLTISIGTQGYVPKEQLGGHPRFSSDVYAVGIIGIQALTGVHPKLLSEDPETGEINWRASSGDVTPELADILDQMIRYDFRVRYATAAEALAALQNLPAALLPSLPEPTTAIVPRQQTQPEYGNNGTTLPAILPESTNSVSIKPELTTRLLNSAQPTQEIEHKASLPTVTPGNLTQRRLIKPLSLVAILLAIGGTGAIAKIVLFPNHINRILSSNNQLTEISNSQPTPSSDQISGSPNPESTSVSSKAQTSPSPTPDHQTQKPSGSLPDNSVTSVPKNTVTKPLASSTPPATTTKPAPAVTSPTVQPSPTKTATTAKPATEVTSPTVKPSPASTPQPDISAAQADWKRCYDLNIQQQPSLAIEFCDRALAINPNYPEALWSKGAAFELQGSYQEALKFYELAIAIKPDFAEAWNNRGTALLKLGRPTEAVAAYEQAIELKPDFANAWANRGAALWDLGRLEQAIASMDKALEIEPNNQSAIQLRELARQKLGR